MPKASLWTRLRYIGSIQIPQGEEWFVAVGAGSTGHLLVVVYTLHGEVIRLISARRATRREKRSYES